MKAQSILVSGLLLIILPLVLAQQAICSAKRTEQGAKQQVLSQTDSQADKSIAAILAVNPEIPRGPLEVLQDYRAQMTLISQNLAVELASISQAVRNGQITRVQAEYLIQQSYQLAVMQYAVFSALYDSLASEVAQADIAVRPPSCQSDSTMVVRAPSSTSVP